MNSPQSPALPSRRVGIGVFAIITVALLAGGIGFYRYKSKHIIQEQHQIIAAVGALKSDQIQNWRKERQSDVRRVVRDPLVRQLTAEFLHDPSAQKVRADLLEQLQINKMVDVYASTFLFALDGHVLLGTDDHTDPVHPDTQRTITAAAASQEAVFSGFFKHADRMTHLDAAAAVRDAEGRPLAVVVLRSDADAFLFPLIQNWPLPNYSAETVLVLRSGDEASVPHKLRFEAETTPRWHQPLTRTTFPAVQVVLGRQGLYEGIDYRGKEVLADLRAIPGSPWFLLNKVDRDEALAQLHTDAVFIGFIIGAFILLAGSGIAYYYRNRQAQGFRALYESEQTKLTAERSLLAANQKIALLFEQTPLGVIEWDLAFRVTRWNPAAEKIFGYSAAEAIGQEAALIVPESARAMVAPIMRALLEGRGGEQSTNENVRKDGTVIQCEWHNASLADAEGHVVGVSSQVEDITERKRTEAALRENEDRYRDLVDNSLELISTYDLEGNFLSVNDTTVRITGYSREALLRMNLSDLAAPETRHLFPEYLRNIQSLGKADGIMLIQTANGEKRFWEYKTTVRTEGVAVPIVRGMGLDITERRKAEKALRKSEELFKIMFEQAPLGIAMIDSLTGQFAQVNPRYAEIAGRSIEEMAALDWMQITHPDDLQADLDNMALLNAGKLDGFWMEKRYLHPDGKAVWVNMTVAALTVQGKVHPRHLCMIEDITERKRVAEEQARLDQALQEAKVELGVAKKASLAKSDFLSSMSHELRTPLIGVTGMLEVLTQSGLDAEQRRVVAIINESSESLLQIIGDILDFSKIEANKMELAPQAFSARALVESLSQIFRSATFAKGLNLLVEVDPGVAPTHVADAMRIRQILNNFLSNAVKFTGRGSILLRLRLLGSHAGIDSLAFDVQDTGIGVSPENISRLFEPFSQAEASTTRRYGGTGLGLTISRRLAELMGGSLAMRSTVGQGSTITLALDLPIGNEQDIVNLDSPDASQAVPRRSAPGTEAAEQERSLVLLAEDHPTNRIVLIRQVNKAGFALEVAVDGQEAFEKWQSGRYALLLTDLHMPRMDGYQLTKAVREWERAHGSPRTPILALTANAMGGEAERCLALGMDDFLVKPVTIPLLASKLHQWMPHVKVDSPEASVARTALAPKSTDWKPGLDSKTLMDLCGGNAASAQEILDDFIATTQADLQLLQDAFQQKDQPCIVRQSHRIKGSAAMIGARDLADRAAKLEAYARTEPAEWETIQEHMQGLQEGLKSLERAD